MTAVTGFKYRHGEHACYVLDRCRCDACKAANSAYQRSRTARLEPAFVAAGPAREHIAELTAAGVGLKQIAKTAGIAYSTLGKLVYGIPGRPPSKRVRKATYDRLLTVTPLDVADGAKCPAGTSWVLIDEMVDAGVPKSAIAAAIGQTGPGLQLSRNQMSGRNVRAIADLYARWRAGTVELVRRDSYGNTTRVEPPARPRRPAADISDLLLDLAEVVEERNAQPWRAEAACRNRPSYLWFPARGDTETARYAHRICAACLVRDQCRAANIDKQVGIYGGLSGKARRDLRHQDNVA